MIINNTPVRTSKNFGINNIELKLFEMPKRREEFNNITISGESQDFDIINEVSRVPLVYGLGEELENQVYENSNRDIKIEVSSNKKKNLYIEYNFDKENTSLIDNIEIIAKPSSQGTIYIKYMSEDEELREYHNGIIKLKASENSNIDVVIINLLNRKADNFLSIENEIHEQANVKYCIVDFGGKTSISNYYSSLEGKNSKSDLNTIYLGTENQLFDINYIVEVKKEQAEANIEVQGALQDNAVKNFKGTIDFKKGCKKAKGNENEFCMLLSDTAKSKALPMLLCTEEDVEGSHSTAAGKVEEDMLFYIMSRGISEKEAMKLIVKAKFNNIINNINDEELRQIILDEIDKRI